MSLVGGVARTEQERISEEARALSQSVQVQEFVLALSISHNFSNRGEIARTIDRHSLGCHVRDSLR
jgi:hypothetical protein